SMAFLDHTTLFLYENANHRFFTLNLETRAWREAGQGPEMSADHLDLAPLFYEFETCAFLLDNEFNGSCVSINPKGMLPFDAEMEVMIRSRLKSLKGANLSSQENRSPLSSICAATFRTQPAPFQHMADEFLENFDDNAFEDDVRVMDKANASWNIQDLDSLPPFYKHLVATFGLGGSGELGDLLPGGYSSVVYLDTDYQVFPLLDGSTPGILTPKVVTDGRFNFQNIHIPAGVTIYGRGSNPLVFTATGEVLIEGTIDLDGRQGTIDVAFDSAFIPNPGGSGGPAAGRGGASQPTVPVNFQAVTMIHTAPAGETGWGPRNAQQIGGVGGDTGAHPDVGWGGAMQHKYSRGAGGGGGTFLQTGTQGWEGLGTFVPDINGVPVPKSPPSGGAPGNAFFTDSDLNNNFFGDKGEYTQLVGGQGGGGAGCRWDSLNPGCIPNTPPGQPHCRWDAKGGGGGGGGGALAIYALGQIKISETGRILARGGEGGRGEQIGSGNFGGGGGGGSGGAVILQSGNKIILEESSDPDPEAIGAIIDVSGGAMGEVQDTVASPGNDPVTPCPENGGKPKKGYCSLARGDGGQGGFGLIQLMVEDPANDLIPAPEDIADAKIWFGAFYFDANPYEGEWLFSDPIDGFPIYERQFFTYDPDVYPRTLIFGDKDRAPFPENVTLNVELSPVVDPYDTISTITSVSYGLSRWIDLGAAVLRPQVEGVPSPRFPGFRGIDLATGIVKTVSNGEVENYYVTGPDSNDIQVSAPSLFKKNFIHEDNEIAVEFQGAQAAAPGLSLPDPESITAWTHDITTLSGSQFIRFRVKLDASKSNHLTLKSIRPQVDMIRIKAQY
ncbi:MAG: hypothetical protein ABIK28_07075, partial [Planctomycetota bacterium]